MDRRRENGNPRSRLAAAIAVKKTARLARDDMEERYTTISQLTVDSGASEHAVNDITHFQNLNTADVIQL